MKDRDFLDLRKPVAVTQPTVIQLEPGSDAAQAKGCTCPAQEKLGYGLLEIRKGCPIHQLEYWRSLGSISS